MRLTFANTHTLDRLLLERVGGLNIMGLNNPPCVFHVFWRSYKNQPHASGQNRTVLQIPPSGKIAFPLGDYLAVENGSAPRGFCVPLKRRAREHFD
jgi:hypothetical protein